MLDWLFSRSKKQSRSRHRYPPCDECKTRSTVVRCVLHNVALCVSCLFMHDDPGTSVYIPDSDKRKHWQDRQAAMRKGKS
jgi:hypothetical protein